MIGDLVINFEQAVSFEKDIFLGDIGSKVVEYMGLSGLALISQTSSKIYQKANDYTLIALLKNPDDIFKVSKEKLLTFSKADIARLLDQVQVCIPLNEFNTKYPICFFNQEFALKAVSSDGYFLKNVPVYLQTTQMYLNAFKTSGEALSMVPQDRITKKLCEKAVGINPFTLKDVPVEFMTRGMCLVATRLNGLALKYVPQNWVTQGMVQRCVDQNPLALEHVSDHFKTKAICRKALQKNPVVFKWIPFKHRDLKISLEAVKGDFTNAQYIPQNLGFEEYEEFLESATYDQMNALEDLIDQNFG